MLSNLETLLELQKQGTMTKASSVLRISQSAVSKRIATLESHYGVRLIEKSGRQVKLTPPALRLMERLSPILSDLRDALAPPNQMGKLRIAMGVSESLLSSWAATALTEVFRRLEVEVEYHAHRSPVVMDKVEAGIYDVGLCAGKISSSRSLLSEVLAPEEMVLVAREPSELRKKAPLNILTIERGSATWKAIQMDVQRSGLNPEKEVESFFAIAQLAWSGFGIGLVPRGVARALGIKAAHVKSLSPRLYRPIRIVYKKSKLERSEFANLIRELRRLKPE